MKCNQCIKTVRVYKLKLRLNIHGRQKEYGNNYIRNSSSVVSWFSKIILPILALINQWHTRQVGIFLAHPQATIYNYLYMNTPKEIDKNTGNRKTHIFD